MSKTNRYEEAIRICGHPHGTEEVIFALYAAMKEVRAEAIMNGPVDDDDFDWDTYLDYAVENDPACILLAIAVHNRFSDSITYHRNDAMQLARKCEEAINARA